MLSVLLIALGGLTAWSGEGTKDMIDCEISLPKGEVYTHGATDPVQDLVVSLVLKNNTPADKRTPADVTVRVAKPLTPELVQKLTTKEIEKGQVQAEVDAAVKSCDSTTQIKVAPVNKDSFGFAYIKPQLGPHELVTFIITKADATVEEGKKPKTIARDMSVEYTAPADRDANAYLAPGTTSPEYILPVGAFYKVVDPGTYKMKAILKDIRDTRTPSGCVESNEVTFTVLPFKVVNRKVDDLRSWWEDYERGVPEFEYMFYQLQMAAPYQEVHFVRKRTVRGIVKWEWRRLCSVKQGGKVQFKMAGPKKCAILSPQAAGDAGLYTVDFTPYDTAVTGKVMQLADKKMPTLVVEGGEAKAE
jgi:hypothetical protein